MNLWFINIFSLLQQPEWKHSFRKERVTRGLSIELKLTRSTRKAQNWRWTKCNSFGQIQIDKSSQKPNKKSKHTKKHREKPTDIGHRIGGPDLDPKSKWELQQESDLVLAFSFSSISAIDMRWFPYSNDFGLFSLHSVADMEVLANWLSWLVRWNGKQISTAIKVWDTRQKRWTCLSTHKDFWY